VEGNGRDITRDSYPAFTWRTKAIWLWPLTPF